MAPDCSGGINHSVIIMKSMSRQPRKQRKSLYIAPLHRKRKAIAAHMAEDLMLKYRRRTFPVIKGDTVKIMRGEFKGHAGKVRSIYTGKGQLEIEGVIITKVDGKKVPRPVHASNVLLTKLNLADPWRRRILEEGLPEEVKKEIEKEAQLQIEEQERMAEEEISEEPEEVEGEISEGEEITEEKMEEVKEEIPEEPVEESPEEEATGEGLEEIKEEPPEEVAAEEPKKEEEREEQ